MKWSDKIDNRSAYVLILATLAVFAATFFGSNALGLGVILSYLASTVAFWAFLGIGLAVLSKRKPVKA